MWPLLMKIVKSLIFGTADRGQSNSNVPGCCDNQAYTRLISLHFPAYLYTIFFFVPPALSSLGHIPVYLSTRPWLTGLHAPSYHVRDYDVLINSQNYGWDAGITVYDTIMPSRCSQSNNHSYSCIGSGCVYKRSSRQLCIYWKSELIVAASESATWVAPTIARQTGTVTYQHKGVHWFVCMNCTHHYWWDPVKKGYWLLVCVWSGWLPELAP
jgi:hypothetical protein